MKFFLIVLTSVVLSGTIGANTGVPVNGDPPGNKDGTTEKAGNSLSNIFYSDYENSTMFIDFQGVNDPLKEVNMLRKDKTVYGDNVQDLPANTIYELNLDVMRKGKYILELVTMEGIKIHKEFVID